MHHAQLKLTRVFFLIGSLCLPLLTLAQPSDIAGQLTIYTLKLQSEDKNFHPVGDRLRSLAEAIKAKSAEKEYTDLPVIFLQGLDRTITTCPAAEFHGRSISPVECLANELKNQFGHAFYGWQTLESQDQKEEMGVIYNGTWMSSLEQNRNWAFAVSDFDNVNEGNGIEGSLFNSARLIHENVLEYRPDGHAATPPISTTVLNVRMTSGMDKKEQKKRRLEAERILERNRSGDKKAINLPPIVLGDFNMSRVFGEVATNALTRIEEYFWRPIDSVRLWESCFDMIFIGKHDAFPSRKFYFHADPEDWLHIPTGALQISDHDAQGFHLTMHETPADEPLWDLVNEGHNENHLVDVNAAFSRLQGYLNSCSTVFEDRR